MQELRWCACQSNERKTKWYKIEVDLSKTDHGYIGVMPIEIIQHLAFIIYLLC